MLNQKQWEKINEIIASIHATKNTYAMRTAFLQKLMRLVDFDFSDFNIGMIRDATPCLVDPVVVSKYNRAFEEDFIHQYESIYAPMDYVNWIFLSRESLIYRESDLVDEKVRKINPFYLHYLKAFDLVNIAGIVLASGGQFVGAITLYRTEKNGDFSDEDLYVLRQLMPHLQNKFDTEEEVMKKNEKSLSYLLRNQYQLTNREIEIIGYIYKGYRNDEIARELNIAPNTVKKHIYNLFYKLHINSRVQLVKFIYNNSLQGLWED
ncbi:MAG TPA: LuxR C-terminal-related transcriptional regulator [Anaerovoracaceae bacterium]|nr:LuxR C-terminal-related transcriptional regulator [Anaerovoracaceae bacterium]